MGRPTLLNDEMRGKLIAAAEAVYHYKYIAGLCGITRQSLDKWLKGDEELFTQIDQARSKYIRNHMRKAKPEFMLMAADREIFGEKKQIELKASPVSEILKAAGLLEGENDDGKDGGSDDGSSENKT